MGATNWKFHKDADNLPPFVPFEFADAVVGFHYFGGFDEYGFTTGGFVMYDAFYFRFKAGATGITSRPSRIVGVTSLSTTPSDWALRRMLFNEREILPIVLASSRRMRASSAEALSLFSVGRKNAVYFSDKLREYRYVSCQSLQTRIRRCGFLFFFIFAFCKSVQCRVSFLKSGAGRKAPARPNTCLPPVSVSGTDVHQKILCRKIIFFLKYTYEFCNLIQAFFYFIKAVGEHHICHSLFAKRTEAFIF